MNHRQKFTRRRFLQSSAVSTMALTCGASLRVLASGFEPYQGKLLFTLQLDGGADVTQLCDPKVNTPGEPKINMWADRAEPGEAGNILFAPVADNASLFRRFAADTVVINGVDSQTNSHDTGKLYSWTGSNAEGKPSLTALHAAAAASEQPLAYAVYGGISRTGGLIPYNRFPNVSRLRELSNPKVAHWSSAHLLRNPHEYEAAEAFTARQISDMLARPDLTPRQRRNLRSQVTAREAQEGLARLSEVLPDQDEMQESEQFQVGNFYFNLNVKQQMQGALLVMKSGLGSSADLAITGFDSHEMHDQIHDGLYSHLADSLYFFWNYAEELGIADRILLVIGSDFGRTNMYNDGQGKDHWNIGSYMIMEQNARWGNRVIGATDELHFAKKIDPKTLQVSSNGVTITPAHVHKSIRNYLGLHEFADSIDVGLSEVEDIPIFNPNLMTRA